MSSDAMRETDESAFTFHEKDSAERCFACGRATPKSVVVRHLPSMTLVHLCTECLVSGSADYLLDNTRAWRPGGYRSR